MRVAPVHEFIQTQMTESGGFRSLSFYEDDDK